MPDKKVAEWNLTWYLESLGLSQMEGERWVEDRRKGRPFKTGSSDEFGKHLDRVWRRSLSTPTLKSRK
jgi:hypothetical protein